MTSSHFFPGTGSPTLRLVLDVLQSAIHLTPTLYHTMWGLSKGLAFLPHPRGGMFEMSLSPALMLLLEWSLQNLVMASWADLGTTFRPSHALLSLQESGTCVGDVIGAGDAEDLTEGAASDRLGVLKIIVGPGAVV